MVTVSVAIAVVHVPFVTLYLIIALPDATPVTTPLLIPTVATEMSLLAQVPFVTSRYRTITIPEPPLPPLLLLDALPPPPPPVLAPAFPPGVSLVS